MLGTVLENFRKKLSENNEKTFSIQNLEEHFQVNFWKILVTEMAEWVMQ